MKDINVGRMIFLWFGGILILGVLVGIGCLVGATKAVQQSDFEISSEERLAAFSVALEQNEFEMINKYYNDPEIGAGDLKRYIKSKYPDAYAYKHKLMITQSSEERQQKATKLRSIAKYEFIAGVIGLILVGLSFSTLFVAKE